MYRLYEVVYDERWPRTRGREPKNCTIEEQLGVEALDDGLRLAKSMLLPLKREQRHGQALGTRRIRHDPGLIGRHDPIFETLKQDNGAREPVDEMNGRPALVKLAASRVRPYQAVEISR